MTSGSLPQRGTGILISAMRQHTMQVSTKKIPMTWLRTESRGRKQTYHRRKSNLAVVFIYKGSENRESKKAWAWWAADAEISKWQCGIWRVTVPVIFKRIYYWADFSAWQSKFIEHAGYPRQIEEGDDYICPVCRQFMQEVRSSALIHREGTRLPQRSFPELQNDALLCVWCAGIPPNIGMSCNTGARKSRRDAQWYI